MYGEMLRLDADGTPHTLGLMHGYVSNQGDGWEFTLDYLSLTVDEFAVSAETPVPGAVFANYAVFAAAMGRRLAEMHAILAAADGDPAFAAEPADTATRAAWANGAIAQLDAAFALLRNQSPFAEPETQRLANDLLDWQDRLRALRAPARRIGKIRGAVPRAWRLPSRPGAGLAR